MRRCAPVEASGVRVEKGVRPFLRRCACKVASSLYPFAQPWRVFFKEIYYYRRVKSLALAVFRGTALRAILFLFLEAPIILA